MRIAVAAHKGGVGKTVTAVNLAAALAHAGRRTLLVDGDPQGAAFASLADRPPAAPTLYEVVMGAAKAADATRPTGIERLDILPSTLDAAGIEVELPARQPRGWQFALRDALAPLDRQYDAIVIDTAPGLGVLPFLALVAATRVLVACTPSFLSYRAMPHVIEVIGHADKLAPPARPWAIVATMVTRRSRHEREVLDALSTDYPGKLAAEIPQRIALQDAQLATEPISTYAPTSDAARIFAELAQEVITNGR